ncbi:peptidase T [Thermodesulfobacteriota bacterium]
MIIKAVEHRLFLDRFLTYVRLDTQSSEKSDTYPSTSKQLDLSRRLAEELEELGLQEVELTGHGYVFATLPSNIDHEIPVIGLIAHIDTSPEVSGKKVTPMIHEDYQGGDILLQNNPLQVINSDTDPALRDCIGHDIITTDGTTLLGSDDKAGIAEIMATIDYLTQNPDVKHGKIRIAFTVDEEVGNGTRYFDIKKFGADYAYTIDGGKVGDIENETFCADTVILSIQGYNFHPGYAKGKMINGIKIAAELIGQLPKNTMSPETTEGREGYIHPHTINGNVELTKITFIVRDFSVDGLKDKERFIKKVCDNLEREYANASISIDVKESYRNMRYRLDGYPEVLEYAIEAVRRAGLQPNLKSVRGGTDGAKLTYMGLPTPNIFTGGHNFHSRKEWISIQDMGKAVETIINLIQIWVEKNR